MKNSYILGAACTVLFALGNSAAYTAPTYSVLVESDPGGLGNLNYGEFASLTDVKNWNVSSSHFIGQNLFGSGVSVGGYTFDGSKYHVLVESDPGGLGNLNLGTFDTLADLKNWNVSSSHFIGQNLFGSGVSVGGFAYDGSKYHVLVESDPGGLGNLNLGTFDTLTDVKNWNVSSSHFIGQNLFGSGVSLGGFTVVSSVSVPEPTTVWLFSTALIGLIGFSKRRKVT
ncbi:PEP-CTERM protein-sorting domain-containing protein [Nitrosomonas aestuarii]|uniref:PEP-CTERM protein-sorting domain-containing protein n=1 Tax=Nitrosomonas aestuarii TaxID=52441 RepID=A0A1I4HIK0_9PROT|nr:PEP-CTERM sorting domain-containing protein [Nitrosomonas aestuarii]SFL41527.1 PEP-CTERM protein-sorting domain-containing protein [Nitrosomonas aestuarii]